MPDCPYRIGAPVRDPEDRVAEVLERARAGNPRTLNTLEEIGRWLGIGASILVNIVNPKAIVLGGYFVPLWPYLVDAAERELARHAIAPVGGAAGYLNGAGEPAQRVRMVPSALGFTAAVRGGAAVAIDAVFADPTRVDGDRSHVDTSAHHQESEVAV
jgi:predicted NBD/HSP70 family sugar kinase